MTSTQGPFLGALFFILNFDSMKRMRFSIIIPAFNEEGNLENAVSGLCGLLEKESALNDYEILIFNDCSSDRTGEIADMLARSSRGIKVVHNPKNMGLGYNFWEGVRLAHGDYVTWFPGDNENIQESFMDTLRNAGKADVVVSYTSNPEVRSRIRRTVSRYYTMMNNLLFNLNLRYYNGLCVYKREALLSLPKVENSFAFAAEILIRLLKSGASHIEVPARIRERPSGQSAAFALKNIAKVVSKISRLFWEIRIKNNTCAQSMGLISKTKI